jgi:CubicO group peptidase (beta-lactamase class C family)
MTTLARADVQTRLAELAYAHAVPGASFALLADDRVTVAASGVLSLDTGVEATPDAVFQLGSIGKSYTATVIVRLAEQGKLNLDAPVRDVLPDFKVADADVTEQVTPRHLLTHTSGIAGECFADTGRGDDCLRLYVEQCAELGQDVPLGATMSYCNTGYCILGRIIEVVTGQVWDTAMREQLLDPLGLTRTVTLPEEGLAFRLAWGHLSEHGEAPRTSPTWSPVPRSLGPAGTVCATAEDALAFLRTHLDGGVGADGTRVLTPDSVAEMQRIHVDVPEPWMTGAHWGLGWIVEEWDGRRIFGHDGNTGVQAARMHAVPEAGVAAVLLTNGGNTRALWRELWDAVVREQCGVAMPPTPEPADGDPAAGAEAIVGRYERYGIRVDVERDGSGLRGRVSIIEPLASQQPDDDEDSEFVVRPSDAGERVFVAQSEEDDDWTPMVVFEVDGEQYLHMGARAQPQVA